MKIRKKLLGNKGFTLIELLLVVGIIGVLLAIIIPKAIRANIDAKYGIVAKNAAELKSFAVQWAEKSIRAQDEQTSVATLADYYSSLTGQTAGAVAAAQGRQWIAITGVANNWNMGTPVVRGNVGNLLPIFGRAQVTAGGLVGPPTIPEDTVEDLIPPEKAIKNPFNGASIFRSPNDPVTQGTPVTGALALGFMQEPVDAGGFFYFAFAYQGTDNTSAVLTDDINSFHAGSGLNTLPALKNGELFARIR